MIHVALHESRTRMGKQRFRLSPGLLAVLLADRKAQLPSTRMFRKKGLDSLLPAASHTIPLKGERVGTFSR